MTGVQTCALPICFKAIIFSQSFLCVSLFFTLDTTTYTLSWARADLYWSCGGGSLLPRLPIGWWGRCALVRLATPVFFLGHKQSNKVSTRQRRNTNFDLAQNSPTYIDSIGIPRGVPDEFKLADQIAAGFENIPLLSALFPITPNKNVDRINYVNYNILRLANLTRDAVEGLAEQLSATSLMAVQNRLALDMLLAEKGVGRAVSGVAEVEKVEGEAPGVRKRR